MRDKKWQIFEDFIVERLKEIDPFCRPTIGSGNKGEKTDIKTDCGLGIEAKQRNTKSVTIDNEVWSKLCSEIPLHADRIPMLALENKEGKRWAVLDLDDFLNLYIELTELRQRGI